MSRPTNMQRDEGMTLPELLIAVVLMGLLTTVISAAIVVTFKTHTSADGRLNLAVAEHSVDLWMPTDLASASSVSIDPLVTPCGIPVCAGVDFSTGSTALLLSWTNRVGSGIDDTVTTTVGYLFAPSSTGDGTYSLTRVECVGAVCTAHVILRGLSVPLNDDGSPTWNPGDAVPSEVIRVTNPLRFENGEEMTDAENIKNARRVVVTINGGGSSDGAGGGTNVISVTAGGTGRGDLPAKAAYQMPSLVQPRSRCGGPIVLIVDESGSLGAAGVAAVRQGVVDFINALDGTPVQLMVVPFNDRARALGGDDTVANWHKYWNMSDPAEVTSIRDLASAGIQIGGGGGGGFTNWEDAWFRTFLNKDGSPAAIVPNTVVFFTDGVPNRDRAYGNSYKADAAANTALPPGNWGTGNNYHWANSSGNSSGNFSNAAFKRAEAIAADYRGAVRLIGVAVGPDIGKYNNLVTGSTARWERRTDISGNRPWQNAGGSNLSLSTYASSTNPTDKEKSSGWAFTSGPGSLVDTFYQLDGIRTRNSDIVGWLVGGNEVEQFQEGGAGEFTNLLTGNLFTSPNWNTLSPALQKIALGQCGGTVNLQTRQGSTTGANVSTTISLRKDAEYYDAAGTQPVPDALVGTTVSTNGVQKTVTIDMNLKDGRDRYIDIVPQGVANLPTIQFLQWACRSGPNAVPMSSVPVIANGVPVPGWQGVRVRVKANQAVSCTLVVT